MSVPNLDREVALDFTLKYSGPIVGGQSTHAKWYKGQLREAFNKQLAILWRVHPTLRDLDPGTLRRRPWREFRYKDVAPKVHYESELWYRCLSGGIDYAPLVTYGHRMHCHLAVRLHSRRAPGGIVHSGADLDNRLKVILDALAMPNPSDSKSADDPASDGEEPLMFCLLEDDELVTKLSVETFRLLKDESPDDPKNENATYVEVDIDVHVTPAAPILSNLPILFPG